MTGWLALLMGFTPNAGSAPAFASFQPPAGLRVQADGSLALDEITFRIQHFGPGFRSAAQSRSTVMGTPVSRRDSWQMDGIFKCANGQTPAFIEKLARTAPGAMTYMAQLTSPEPVPTQQLALGIDLPIAIFMGVPLKLDGETFTLPKTPFTQTMRWRDIKRLECPTPRGRLRLEGAFSVQLQDGRNFADKRDFRLRVLFNPEKGDLRTSSLSLTFHLQAYAKDEAKPAFGAYPEVRIEANEEWKPLAHQVFTRPGSVLDWSFMSDAPAGKHGWVLARNGHFEFEQQPGRRHRFFGVNICDRANYLDKHDAEALAAQLTRLGHNTVRLHHYDRHLVKAGKTLAAGWDPAQLDRFDYLFHCLKQAGLYVTIDLYTVRKVVAGEIQEINRDVYLNEFKALVAVSPSARANWKEFARRLLTHVNPYTGLAWKDDPALFGICLLNEDDTAVTWDSAPDIAALYQKRFADWQQAQGAAQRSREEQWARFLMETHQNMARDLTAFLRGLGVRSLITDANYRQNIPLALLRQEFDYVDNHSYHDLKKFLGDPWSLPYGFHQRPAVSHEATLPRDLFGARQFGKPYTVTEFNFCYPNHFRAEGGALMGAYAALQDWDALYRYAYAHAPERATSPQAIFYLDNAGDPLNLLADRIAVLLFRRGDVRPATNRVPYLFSEGCLDLSAPLDRPHGMVPPDFERLGLLTQIGSIPISQVAKQATGAPFAVSWEAGAQPKPKSLEVVPGDGGALRRFLAGHPAPAAQTSPEAQRFVSETGEIRLESAQGRMTVSTDRTECFVLSGPETVRGRSVEVRNHGGFTAVCVSAMDDRPVATSRHLLVIHLTDVQNTGVTFRDEAHTILTNWGHLPHLVRRGAVDLRFPPAGPGNVAVHALQLDGTPAHEMAAQRDDSGWGFTAATVQPQGTFLVYEIKRD